VTGIWYTDLLDVLDDAGVAVAVSAVNAGWETRSRNSGGFPVTPLAVVFHHTASKTSPYNDLSYMIDGSPDAPVGNMLLDRDGVVWPVAAGAANTAGKGGPAAMSRGVIPLDQGNTHTWNIEAANNGVGEPWPVDQIDAYFAASNALNAHFGNQPEDVLTHALGDPAVPGWTSRKIDPATATAVEGLWFPGSVTSSGTWSLEHIRIECRNRANPQPPQPQPPQEDPDMPITFIAAAPAYATVLVAIDGAGTSVLAFATDDDLNQIAAAAGNPPVIHISGPQMAEIMGRAGLGDTS
jgi:hypothetical protein